MIFVRKGQNAKTSRLNKRPSHEVKAAQMRWRFAWLCSYFLCCLTGPCMIWYTELRLHCGVISGFVKAGKQNKKTKREKRKGKKSWAAHEALPLSAQVMHTERGIKFTHSVVCACFPSLSFSLPFRTNKCPLVGVASVFRVCVFCSFNIVQTFWSPSCSGLMDGFSAAAFLFCLVRVWFSLLPAAGGNDSGSCGGRFPNNRIRFFFYILFYSSSSHWDAFLC